jgi:pimeloyl-ACP methyl ester carboxylesterase
MKLTTTRTTTTRGRRRPLAAVRVLGKALSFALAAVLTLAPARTAPVAAQTAPQGATAPGAAAGDFAGLVDIGGRRLYLECRGTGSPTVVLVSGYRASGRYWTDDLLQPDAPRTMVLPRLAGTTRVCAYDRPGTYAPFGEDVLLGRSDPVPQPRTEADAVAELHALLGAAGVPGPYVLGAHSLGGLMARLYAAAYPGEVVGLVLVDAYNEQIEALMTPEQWAALVRFNVDSGSDTVLPIPDYGPVETIPYGGGNPRIRRAVAATPLPALPLAVLAHVRPFELPTSVGGLSPEAMEGILGAANAWQATLAPRARYFAAHASGHDVHQDQPALVAEAIRQVVAGVRDPDTWSDLTVCCDPTAGSVAAAAARS